MAALGCARAMATTMATTHQIDNEKLIGSMEARPALWQSKHPEHRNRFKKGVLWDEVAAAVLPGAPAADAVRCLQTRWKYLRDKYRRVMNEKRRSHKSGKGAEDDFDATDDGNDDDDDTTTTTSTSGNSSNGNRNWQYFKQLDFLKDDMMARPTTGNMDGSEHVETAEQIFNRISADFEDLEEISFPRDDDGNPGLSPLLSDTPPLADTLPDQLTPRVAAIPTGLPAPQMSHPPLWQPTRQKKRKRISQTASEIENLCALLWCIGAASHYIVM
ncbi:uncharacterized protein LOC144164263 [Haemaphysalis longicornis]